MGVLGDCLPSSKSLQPAVVVSSFVRAVVLVLGEGHVDVCMASAVGSVEEEVGVGLKLVDMPLLGSVLLASAFMPPFLSVVSALVGGRPVGLPRSVPEPAVVLKVAGEARDVGAAV